MPSPNQDNVKLWLEKSDIDYARFICTTVLPRQRARETSLTLLLRISNMLPVCCRWLLSGEFGVQSWEWAAGGVEEIIAE